MMKKKIKKARKAAIKAKKNKKKQLVNTDDLEKSKQREPVWRSKLKERAIRFGEVARIISRTYGDQSFKESEQSLALGDELADVLFVLICIANQTGVDLTDAFRRNLVKKTERDRDRHRSNRKLT